MLLLMQYNLLNISNLMSNSVSTINLIHLLYKKQTNKEYNHYVLDYKELVQFTGIADLLMVKLAHTHTALFWWIISNAGCRENSFIQF